MIGEQKAQDILRPKLITGKMHDGVVEISKKMKQYNVGCIVILDHKDKTAGIITERDIVHKVLPLGKKGQTLRAQDIMTTQIRYVKKDTHIHEVIRKMHEYKVRHLLVSDDNSDKVVGVISARDLIEKLTWIHWI